MGARPLRRAIQRLLEDPLSEQVLLGNFKAGSTILVTVEEGADDLTFEAVEAPAAADTPVAMAGQE
jgi:ATP-dependent Clp protease ATP-binding subunit ClpC